MRQLLIFVVIIFNCSIYAQDFRNTHWGSTIEEMKASESDQEWKQHSDYCFKEIYFLENNYSIKRIVVFSFLNDTLVSGGYSYQIYANRDSVWNEFYKIEEILTEKYGPSIEAQNRSFLFGPPPREYNGYVSIMAKRYKEKNEIYHGISITNPSPGEKSEYHNIFYYPFNGKSLIQEKKAECKEVMRKEELELY